MTPLSPPGYAYARRMLLGKSGTTPKTGAGVLRNEKDNAKRCVVLGISPRDVLQQDR